MVIDSSWLPVLLVVGIGLFLLSILMLGFCYWFRRKRTLREESRQQVIERYRPLLFDWIGGDSPTLEPPGNSNEWLHLISLWNDLYGKVGQSEHEQLRQAAVELGLPDKAQELLESNKSKKKIMGVITLGHLGDTDHVDRIEELTESSVRILRMQSIKALCILEPERGLEIIYDDLVENSDQSHNYYLSFCRSIDADCVTRVTLDRLETVPEEAKPRIIPFLKLGNHNQVRTYLRQEIKLADQPEIISACLKVLRQVGEPSDQNLVSQYLFHSADFVRIQAARALGSIGTADVVDDLMEALSDPNWWVRCRSAQALVQLPSTGINELRDLLNSLEESRARQALQSAIDEVDIG